MTIAAYRPKDLETMGWLKGQTPLQALSGRRFLAREIVEAFQDFQFSQHDLTNYLSKTDLELCSESGGQGRARQFYLIDVYQLLLFHLLMAMGGDAEQSAHYLDSFLFDDPESNHNRIWIHKAAKRKNKDTEAKVNKRKEEVGASIKKAPKLYWWRDLESPLFLWVNAPEGGIGSSGIRWGDQADLIANIGAANVIVVTRVLSKLDLDLAHVVAKREKA